MSKLTFITLPLLGTLLFLLASIPIKAEGGSSYPETIVFDPLKLGVENVDPKVTAFDTYARVYFGDSLNRECYQCTSQCSDYSCCTGSHPQCCYAVGTGCRCCAP